MTNQTPIVRAESYIMHTAWCVRCGAATESRDARAVEGWTDSHERMHALYAEVAASIVGQVFDIDAPGTPWLGHIVKAEEAAHLARKPYLLWNGNVYAAEPCVDLTSPVCTERDWREAAQAVSGSSTEDGAA